MTVSHPTSSVGGIGMVERPHYESGNEPGIVWLPPASGVIEPTKMQVKTPNLARGRYGTPDGWLDVTEQNDPSPLTCKGNDPVCPCQDGLACHYEDLPGSPAWPT